MRYVSSILLVCTLLIGEMHTFWAGDTRVQNWIINRDVPMLIEWNVKFAASQVVVILYFVAWVFYMPNRVNKSTLWAFLAFSVLDTGVYFYNFKTYGYGSFYVWFLCFWGMAYYLNRPYRQ